MAANTRESQIPEPNITRFLFADTRMAPVWLIVRVYLGALWLLAGWGKLTDPAWLGSERGAAVSGFAQGAMAQTTGEHAQVTGWYASFGTPAFWRTSWYRTPRCSRSWWSLVRS